MKPVGFDLKPVGFDFKPTRVRFNLWVPDTRIYKIRPRRNDRESGPGNSIFVIARVVLVGLRILFCFCHAGGAGLVLFSRKQIFFCMGNSKSLLLPKMKK